MKKSTEANFARTGAAFEAAGIEFTNGGKPGLRMKSPY
jgi:hypothetical protein